MLKNLAILLFGLVLGIAGTLWILNFNSDETPSSSLQISSGKDESVTPVIDLNLIYDQLMEEKRGEPEEKHWFEKELEEREGNSSKKIEELQSEGDEAAKVFKQFAKPE